MRQIIDEKFMCNVDVGGTLKKSMRVDFAIDSVNDLPTVDYKDGHVLSIGSTAWNVASGDIYGLSGSGVWIDQATSSEVTLNQQQEESEPE